MSAWVKTGRGGGGGGGLCREWTRRARVFVRVVLKRKASIGRTEQAERVHGAPRSPSVVLYALIETVWSPIRAKKRDRHRVPEVIELQAAGTCRVHD
jgi:hypothetical protein